MAFESGYLLAIGVGRYTHHPHLDIPISARDAQAVAGVFCDPEVGGYPPEQVTLLHDMTATRKEILGALAQLAEHTTADATVVLFYCGHGAYNTDGTYCLTTHDTEIADGRIVAGTETSEAELVERLRRVPARRLLMLVNACHAGEALAQP